MDTMVSRVAQSSAVHLGFAFLAMGGWAVFANRGHPLPSQLLAGLVQGTTSACITLVLKRAIEFLAAQFSGVAALVLPPALAFAISASALTLIHTVAGTPEIARTIAVPLTVATSYAALYNFSLWRARRKAA